MDPYIEGRLKELGKQIAKFSYLHNSERIKKFLEEWEQGPENPGGD